VAYALDIARISVRVSGLIFHWGGYYASGLDLW
jgi:hypothetical protein